MLDAKTLISNSGLCRDNLHLMFSFELIAEDGEARVGRLTTPHGSIGTPSFVSVATHGTVNTLSAHELHGLGVKVIIANCLPIAHQAIKKRFPSLFWSLRIAPVIENLQSLH